MHGYNAVSSICHELATQATSRFSRGYTVQVASGELQGVMEVQDIRLDRGLSAFDATHRLAANFLWELPFFRGSGGLVRSLFGGWQANGIVSLQSRFRSPPSPARTTTWTACSWTARKPSGPSGARWATGRTRS